MTTRPPTPCPSSARPPKTPQAGTLGPSRSTPAPSLRHEPPRRRPNVPRDIFPEPGGKKAEKGEGGESARGKHHLTTFTGFFGADRQNCR